MVSDVVILRQIPTKPGRILPGPVIKREQTATIRPFSVTKSTASTSGNDRSPNNSDPQRKDTDV